MSYPRSKVVSVVGLVLLVGAAAWAMPGTDVLYVDDDAPPAGDGTSWETAYRFLSDALVVAGQGGISEIRVAQGTYNPDRSDANPDGTGDRYASFQLLNSLTLNGGYKGIGAGDPDARDIELYETILSGDLLGDDGPDFQNNAENSIHVVSGSFTTASAVLDGFTITAGNANGPNELDKWGAGIFNDHGWPRILRCTIIKHESTWWGSGIYNQEFAAWLEDCKFIDCSAINVVIGAHTGAYIRCTFTGSETGLECNHSGPLVKDCVFKDIVIEDAYQSPIYSVWASPQIINCVFVDNIKQGDGGAIKELNTFFSSVTNCLFINNYATGNGGAIYIDYGCPGPKVTNCTFYLNSAGGTGNVSYNGMGSPTFSNCELAWTAAPAIVDDGPDAQTTVRYSNISGGWKGKGTNNISADPLFVDPTNGDFRLQPGSPCIDAADNEAVPKGIGTDLDGEARFVDDPDTKDTGNGAPPIVDIGAYEFQVETLCPWDLDGNGSVGAADLLALLVAWGSNPGGPPDFDGDGSVGASDLLALLVNWGPCP